jgi:hypothetical protein
MRYPASEKLEIIRLVEQSHLPVRRTLEKLGVSRATFAASYRELPAMFGNFARFEPPPSSGRGNFNAAASWIDPKSVPRLWTSPEQGTRRKRFRDNPIQAMRVRKAGKAGPRQGGF